MKTNETKNLNPEERTKGLKVYEKEEGRWITAWLEPQEVAHLIGVKSKWSQLGLKMSFSKILRQIISKGMTQIDWEAAKQDPLTLFSQEAA